MITGRFVTQTGRLCVFPSYGLIVVTLNLLALARWAPHLSAAVLPWLLWNA
jgi:hypothetical protein